MGGKGIDSLTGSGGADTLMGGSGNKPRFNLYSFFFFATTPRECNASIAVVLVSRSEFNLSRLDGPGNDVLRGGKGGDFLSGQAGNDNIAMCDNDIAMDDVEDSEKDICDFSPSPSPS